MNVDEQLIWVGTDMDIRLIVVSTESNHRIELCDLLKSNGMTANCMNHPSDALEYLKDHQCELILSDIDLPDMSGVDFIAQALIADPFLSPILMVAPSSLEAALETFQSGVQGFILKPFKPNMVMPVIQKALNIRKLRMENDALVRELTQSNQQLSELNEELDLFAGRAAHDLKSVIHIINGYANNLSNNSEANSLSEFQMRCVQRITEFTERGSQLITDLLCFARLGTKDIKKTAVDLRTLVSRVKVISELEHNGPRPVWRIGELPKVLGDEKLLETVFMNLFSNALKFSSQNQVPQVEVQHSECSHYVHITVKDNGVGFDPNLSKNLFKPFQRLHNIHEFDGNGLGLANVRRIVERHHGKISGFSAVGHGATFSVSLPKTKCHINQQHLVCSEHGTLN